MAVKFKPFTFRTFPDASLKKHGLESIFRFGKIKEDLIQFETFVESSGNIHLIGFALSHSSRTETVAINKFNRGTVERHGPDKITLEDVLDTGFNQATTAMPATFCNYTCYKLARNYKVSFYHLSPADVDTFLQLLIFK